MLLVQMPLEYRHWNTAILTEFPIEWKNTKLKKIWEEKKLQSHSALYLSSL